MEYKDLRNPVWDDKTHTGITVEVNFTDLGWVPFACRNGAAEDYAREIFLKALAMGPKEKDIVLIPLNVIHGIRSNELKFKRRAVEALGIKLDDGRFISSDKDSRTSISAVLDNADMAGINEVDFKLQDGTWITLEISVLRKYLTLMVRHVQTCFTLERAHDDAIDALLAAGDRNGLENYDVNKGWPTEINTDPVK